MSRTTYRDWITQDGLIRLESWARDGLTNEQIAKNIGVHESTLYDWIRKYPEISESIKRGKAPVDFEVENALLKSALGFEYTETEEWAEVVDGEVKKRIKKIKKYSPPNPTAMVFWLKNRKPNEWRRMSTTYEEHMLAETRKLEVETKQLERELKNESSTLSNVIIVDRWNDDND